MGGEAVVTRRDRPRACPQAGAKVLLFSIRRWYDIALGSEERDYVVKRDEYFAHGIWEYVIVDPFRKVVTVLSRGARGYLARELRDGEVYTSRQLPGFEFPIVDLAW